MAQAAVIFSSHMVLQRNKRIALFGTGTAGEVVTAKIGDRNVSVTTTADINGKWLMYLPAMEGGLNFTLTITGDGTYEEFTDVVTGEVWLAGGQSNMEYFLINSTGGQEELKNISTSNVRCFDVYRDTFKDENYLPHQRTNSWKLPSEENSALWSAAAYYAAKDMSQKLGVTVGIIGCNLGGTSASCWLPDEDLKEHLSLSPYLEAYAKGVEGKTEAEMIREYDEYIEYHLAWEKRMAECYGKNPDIKWQEVIEICGENRYPGPMNIKSPFRPSGTYETMFKTVIPYTIGGFWYYQGESDDHLPHLYYTLFTALIYRWRSDFMDNTLPFVFCQLPSFAYEDLPDAKNWCPIREAQGDVYKTVKNTAVNVILDCGTFGDIHPKDKRIVGSRMAQLSINLINGTGDGCLSPVYKDFAVNEEKVVISFDCEDKGLCLCGEGNGFELTDGSGVYYPAKAELSGNKIILTCEKVKSPVNARYAWKNYPEYSLYSTDGVPVMPFRTDRQESYDLCCKA